MSEGGLVLRQETFFRSATGQNALEPGTEFVAVVLDTAPNGFEVRDDRGTVTSVHPWAVKKSEPERHSFTDQQAAVNEYDDQVDAAHRKGFCLSSRSVAL